jgi:hypothetical protein
MTITKNMMEIINKVVTSYGINLIEFYERCNECIKLNEENIKRRRIWDEFNKETTQM